MPRRFIGPYWPRSEILARLEDEHGVRLVSADVISDEDLRALFEVIKGLREEISDLLAKLDDAHEDISSLEYELEEP